MPEVTITISEQQEAKIAEAIHGGHDFRVDGGRIAFGGVEAELKCISFNLARTPSNELQNHSRS